MPADRPPWNSPDTGETSTRRLLAATPAQVFAAFADPERLARWWGPAGFTNTFDHFDFRPGGEWRFTMHGPDRGHFPNHSRFVEIAPDERIVLEHLTVPRYLMTLSFTAEPKGTLVDWHMRFESAAMLDKLRSIVEPGNEQNLDRLTAELGRTAEPSTLLGSGLEPPTRPT